MWTRQVAYTRFYIIETVAGLPQANSTAARLLHNQEQIGAAIAPFYGDDAGTQLTALLRAHLTGAVAVIAAAKSGNADALATAKAAWYGNADDIARFLADANPNWSFDLLDKMLHTHLDQTIAEATARLTAQWDADVRSFDAIVAHIRDLADVLADGIATQFPDKVSCGELSIADELHLKMRALWEDHMIWTRIVIIEATAHATGCTTAMLFPDLQVELDRLLRNQDDIGNGVRQFLGDAGADQLTSLLRAHITIAVEVVQAAVAGDSRKLEDASKRWYENADDLAKLIASALPIAFEDAQAMLHEHLDQTTLETVDQLSDSFDAAIADYDTAVAHMLDFADLLSAGIRASFDL